MLIEKEKQLLDSLADAWNGFCKLEGVHPDHLDEFRYALHQAERIVMVRAVMVRAVKRELEKEEAGA